MLEKKYKIGIVGGTSLLAQYLIQYLYSHTSVDLSYIDSKHNPGEMLKKFHKSLPAEIENRKLDKYSPDFIKKNLDLVFISKPHTQAMKYVKELYNAKLKIIDLSGDFRIKNIAEYEKYYKTKHTAKDLVKNSIYGLTEINNEAIKKAVLIANPGCYPTGIILPLFPLVKNSIIDPASIYITSYSGVSGAGKNPVPGKNLFLDAFNNIMAYKINIHQHTPEIEEQLSFPGKKCKINFIPHLASMENGIFNTIFCKLQKKSTLKEVEKVLKDYYKKSRFIKINTARPPQIKDIVGTNKCLIYPAFNKETNTLLLISVIDNRIKGGAGQAIQNMNLMLGLNEDSGLGG